MNLLCFGHCHQAFWSLSIVARFEHFVIVEECKQDYKALTCSSLFFSCFAGKKIHGYSIYTAQQMFTRLLAGWQPFSESLGV